MSGEYGGRGKVRLPSACPVYIFLRVLLHVDEHRHGAKLVCHDVWRTLAVFFFFFFTMLGSVLSIVVYSEQL